MECLNKGAKFNVTETWLDSVASSHSDSKSTRYSYKKNFLLFCKYIGKPPEQIINDYETAELQHIPERSLRRRYGNFLKGWKVALKKEGFASGTIFIMVAAVQSFFKYNDLGLGFIPMGKIEVTYHNRDLTKNDILEIVKSSNPREKAFFIVMAQSGLRPHTISALRYENLLPDFENGTIPCKIEVPKGLTKGKYQSYFSFVGEDAINALKDYFNADKEGQITPESYVFSQKGHDNLPMDRRIPSRYFHERVVALNKKGIVDYSQKAEKKPGTVRMYGLRKWFRKQAAQAGEDYTNFWMGHLPKNPSDSRYFAPDEGNQKKFSADVVEHHREIYAEKAMPHLRLETATPSEEVKLIQKQNKEIEQLHEELTQLKWAYEAEVADRTNWQREKESLKRQAEEANIMLAEARKILAETKKLAQKT